MELVAVSRALASLRREHQELKHTAVTELAKARAEMGRAAREATAHCLQV